MNQTGRKYRRVQKDFTGVVSMTKQSHKEECDVNNILEKYRKTGLMTHIKNGGAVYGDFSNIASYKEAVDSVRLASETFMQLPANIRKKFDNDPGVFLDFTSDPKNLDEMRKLGLLKDTVVVDSEAPSNAAPAGTDANGGAPTKTPASS